MTYLDVPRNVPISYIATLIVSNFLFWDGGLSVLLFATKLLPHEDLWHNVTNQLTIQTKNGPAKLVKSGEMLQGGSLSDFDLIG